MHVANLDRSKKWGVWGYGIGGSSAVEFLCLQGIKPIVFDAKPFSEATCTQLHNQGVTIAPSLEQFLKTCDVIIPSPGIDLRGYAQYAHKWLAELDLFMLFAQKPIIAVTGSLGKTTVTHTIGAVLQRAGKKVLVGGNIGIGLCSLLARQAGVDYIVLEVSSFQLELCTLFSPHVAVWTNFYPNHLDRHGTLEAYFAAKANLLARQGVADHVIVWAELSEQLHKLVTSPRHWRTVAEQGYAQNRCYVQAVMDALGIAVTVADDEVGGSLEHRLEFVRQINGIDFYNDSKSTVPQATLAALDRLTGRPIILLLGGLSKGVDRRVLIAQLVGRVKMVICVGAESAQLCAWCALYGIPCEGGLQFDESVKIAYTKGVSGDVVLLSPSGSSFDLFANYQQRGVIFKQLVAAL